MKFKVTLYLLLVLCFSACSQQQTRFQPPIPVGYKPAKPMVRDVPKTVYSPPATSVKVPFLPKKGGLIVIDPGHGGEDFGTYSKKIPKYQEKHLTLATARMLNNYLQQMGYETLMTRNEDVFISLDKRALIANIHKPKVFVSIHYNSAPSKDAEGIEVFYYRSDQDKSRTADSKRLAQAVLDKLLDATKAKSRGIKHGNLAVVRETKMPAILIEGGFLTNDKERENIKDASYMKRVAYGIALGIQDYIAKNGIVADR